MVGGCGGELLVETELMDKGSRAVEASRMRVRVEMALTQELEPRAGGGLVRTSRGTLLFTTEPDQTQPGRHLARAAAPAGTRLANQEGVGLAVMVEVEPLKTL